MNSRIWQGYGIGLLMLALLFVFAIPFYAKRISEVLEYDAQELLNHRGIEWVRVQADGRDLVLSGEAPSVHAYRQARRTVREIHGVRHVVDRMTTRIVTPYTMNIDWRDGRLTAEGFMPNEASSQEIRKLMADTYGDDHTSGKLRIALGSPEGWTELLVALFTWMGRLEHAHAEIADQQLHLSGETSSSDMRDRLVRALTVFEQQGYRLDLQVTVDDTSARICQQEFNELLKTSISFESNEARISQQSRSLIERLAETAKLCPNTRITIAGHTDNQGDSQDNLELSEQRARAVASQLFEEGIEPGRIKTVGYGADRPVADNSTEAGRANNRRIEFVVEVD